MQPHKLSKYIVITEPIINDSYQIIYSTRTAKRVLLKAEAVTAILNNNFNTIRKGTFLQLVEHKIIVDANENELQTILQNNNIAIENDTELYYVIQPTANCQLGCDYCGQVHTKDDIKMSLDDKIVQRIRKKLVGNNKYNVLRIGWFGGEPLLGYNTIKRLTPKLKDLANEFNCSYQSSMVTNGLSLKKNIFSDLSLNYNVSEFEITIDGTKEFHDSRRHTKFGEPTFDIIVGNIVNILSEAPNPISKINIRCNIDNRNKESIFDLIEEFDNKGILLKIHKLYIAPIHSWGNDAHSLSLSKEDYAKLEIEFYIRMQKKGILYTSLLPDSAKPIVCMAVQNDAELIDAFGNIYNCTEVSQVPTYQTGENTYKIDNLNNASNTPLLNKRPLSDWNDDVLNGKFPCSTCRILPICGGACPKSWHENISPCPPIKYNIKDRLIFDLHKEFKQKKSLANA